MSISTTLQFHFLDSQEVGSVLIYLWTETLNLVVLPGQPGNSGFNWTMCTPKGIPSGRALFKASSGQLRTEGL